MGRPAVEADPRWYEMEHVFRPCCPAPFANAPTGKILKDEDTVETYKIEEKGFVVCVVNKVRPHTLGLDVVRWTCR